MGRKANPALENIQLKRQINELLLKIAEMEVKLEYIKGFTIQQALDEAQITLNEGFGFGPGRNRRFEALYLKNIKGRAADGIIDSKDDKEITYTKGCLDRDLRRARGEDTPPFDVRYDPENLYFRRELEKQLREENKL